MTMRRFRSIVWAGVAAGAMVGLSCAKMSNGPVTQQAAAPATQPAVANASATQPAKLNQIALDLDRAIPVDLPHAKKELSPVWFKTDDGKTGWVVRLPGGRPIATPAYADGMLFVGGGYGSHEFYCLDAKTGAMKWTYKCEDDGPTAAVVDSGYVAFDTESCEIEVLEVATGKRVWKEYLGDPLMSQPAIANGKLYIAYPGGSPKGVRTGNMDADDAVPKPAGPAKGRGHRLLCADLKTGKHLWEQDITADVVSAPVIDGDRVYLTCFDGTSFCINSPDGAVAWKQQNKGTSAPLVVDGNVVITQKSKSEGRIEEGMKRVDLASGVEKDKLLLAAGEAKYLKPGAAGNTPYSKVQEASLDSSVGFAAQKITAESPANQSHLNIGSVAVGWSYQGARAAYSKGNLLNAQGNMLNCIRSSDAGTAWRLSATGKDVAPDAQLFAPPALGEKNMYVCSASGHLLSVRQSDGQVNFNYALKQPMAFQPTLAAGNVYVGTTDGRIICLQTGDADADGWYAWGGNAQHNKSR